MADDSGVMFTPQGWPTGQMQGRWRAKGGKVALQPRGRLIEADGRATAYFRSVWRGAFPAKPALPFEPVATQDGRLSPAILNIWP